MPKHQNQGENIRGNKKELLIVSVAVIMLNFNATIRVVLIIIFICFFKKTSNNIGQLSTYGIRHGWVRADSKQSNLVSTYVSVGQSDSRLTGTPYNTVS